MGPSLSDAAVLRGSAWLASVLRAWRSATFCRRQGRGIVRGSSEAARVLVIAKAQAGVMLVAPNELHGVHHGSCGLPEHLVDQRTMRAVGTHRVGGRPVPRHEVRLATAARMVAVAPIAAAAGVVHPGRAAVAVEAFALLPD